MGGKYAHVAEFAFMDYASLRKRFKQVSANKETWATLRSLEVSGGIGADWFSHVASPDMELEDQHLRTAPQWRS